MLRRFAIAVMLIAIGALGAYAAIRFSGEQGSAAPRVQQQQQQQQEEEGPPSAREGSHSTIDVSSLDAQCGFRMIRYRRMNDDGSVREERIWDRTDGQWCIAFARIANESNNPFSLSARDFGLKVGERNYSSIEVPNGIRSYVEDSVSTSYSSRGLNLQPGFDGDMYVVFEIPNGEVPTAFRIGSRDFGFSGEVARYSSVECRAEWQGMNWSTTCSAAT